VANLTGAFRLNPVAQLHWVGWDDEYVVFEESSGQTHQLDAFRAFVLNSALEGEIQVSDLLADMVSAMTVQSPEAATQLLHSVIEEFETVGLLERTSV
jgi:PqqD family protein of HPr-rel-A system